MVRRFIIRNLRVLILFLIFAVTTTNIAFAQNIKGENEEINDEISLATNRHCDEISDVFKKNEDKIAKEKKKKKERERKLKEERQWESLGECRITTYCPACNDPAGSYQSSSGTTLYEGCVACSWLPIGTRLRIDGYEYVVMDTCGIGGTVDIFVDTGGYCNCNTLSYKEVYIRK